MKVEITNPNYIINSFVDITTAYQFTVEIFKFQLNFKNKYATLVFYKDWGFLECDLIQNGKEDEFSLKSIPYYGFNSDFRLNEGDVLEAYKFIINNYLKDSLLYGDFNWIKRYLLNYNLKINRIAKVKSLPNTDPIKSKFQLNDPTWELDLIEKFPELK